MKKRIRLKGRIRTYIQFTLYLGLLLLAIDAAVFMLDFRAGLLTFGFTIFYFAITLTLYFYNKPIIMNELISFATEYGQIQRKLLRDLELPYALLDDSGKVIWTNIAFENVVHQPKGYSTSILIPVFSSINSLALSAPPSMAELIKSSPLSASILTNPAIIGIIPTPYF
jgi:c-di-AMP phosphodiesterase-like protein